MNVSNINNANQPKFKGTGQLFVQGKKSIKFKTSSFQDKLLTELCDSQYDGQYQFHKSADKSTAFALKLFFKTLLKTDFNFNGSGLSRNYGSQRRNATSQEIVFAGSGFRINIKNKRAD